MADLCRGKHADVRYPVLMGAGDDRGEALPLLLIPRDHDRRGLHKRQVKSLMHQPVFAMSALDAARFPAAGSGVEAGVKETAVALAGAVDDIGIALQEKRASPGQDEGAEGGASHNSRADDCDIVLGSRLAGRREHRPIH